MNYLHFHFSFLITFCKHFSSDLRHREDPVNTVFLPEKGNGREFSCVEKNAVVSKWSGVVLYSWELWFDAV